MFKKILVANRGEIAVRIIRTCRDMGISTVAVYEESDRASLHVMLADECARLDTADGYMRQESIIQLAIAHKADAIHPGYGFLAENSEFASACVAAGLSFIGPSAETLAVCSSKIELLKEASSCGLPVPEHSGRFFTSVDIDSLVSEAEKLGFPLLVKALRGSNLRAAKPAQNHEELPDSVAFAARQGEMLFGDGRVYLEKVLSQSRTVAFPFIAEHNGEIILLGSMDLSLHRHSNRIFCESPAPGFEKENEVRTDLLNFIRKIGYAGVGAAEFLLDQKGACYFIGMQARIQLEHPVAELRFGIDLVQEQIRIAAGKSRSAAIKEPSGTAMQCRLYAVDLLRGSMPSTGILSRFRLPGGPHVRVDAYAYGGCSISPHFDPLLATVACWGENRDECLRRMRRALRDTAITGVKTNLSRIQVLLHDRDLEMGSYNCDTAAGPERLSFSDRSNPALAAIAAIAFKARSQAKERHQPERLSGGWHASIKASFEQ